MSAGKYNYTKEGDIKGKRTLDWYRNCIFGKLIWKKSELLLDIGSGNGRLNSIFKDYFNTIHNVDPDITLNKKFDYGNVTFDRCTFEDFRTDKKFDCITFMCSFYIMVDQGYKILDRCYNLLRKNGRIIIVDGTLHIKEGSKKSYSISSLEKKANELGMWFSDYKVNSNIETIIFMLSKESYEDIHSI